MGFPMACRVDMFPELFIHTLYLIASLVSTLSDWMTMARLSYVVGPEDPTRSPTKPSIPTRLTRELLPVIVFAPVDPDGGMPASCAVCLCEFQGEEEIRWLPNCRHIFHRDCLDRWMDQDQITCPLCRTRLLPRHLQEDFERSLGELMGC